MEEFEEEWLVRNSVEGFTKIEKKQSKPHLQSREPLAFMRERKKSSGSRFSCSIASLVRWQWTDIMKMVQYDVMNVFLQPYGEV